MFWDREFVFIRVIATRSLQPQPPQVLRLQATTLLMSSKCWEQTKRPGCHNAHIPALWIHIPPHSKPPSFFLCRAGNPKASPASPRVPHHSSSFSFNKNSLWNYFLVNSPVLACELKALVSSPTRVLGNRTGTLWRAAHPPDPRTISSPS